MPVLAYLITFHTYGSWLHGRAPGSVDRRHNRVGTAFAPSDAKRYEAMRRRMGSEPFTMTRSHRDVVRSAIEGVVAHRGWKLRALHVRTNHVHVVVTAGATPERVMNDFKAWATRRLREADLVGCDAAVWGRHGSTRYLNTQNAVERAIHYVKHNQGVDLD